MLRKMRKLQREYDLKVSAFVLMGNHFHLLALTPNEPIDRIMYFFMKEVTKEFQKRSGRINRIFGGRYKGCLIDNSRYLLNVYKYILRNPVAAGISERAEDYKFSTLYMKNSGEIPGIQIEEIMPMNLAVSKDVEINWINSGFEDEEINCVRWGLSKTRFEYKKIGSKITNISELSFLPPSRRM